DNGISPLGNDVAQKWKFLGVERQEEFGLNWDSYKWRNADPAIGRFFGVDPIAEDYPNQTPYQFASNNPVWKVELEGLEGIEQSGEDWMNGLGYGVDPGDGSAVQVGSGGFLSKGYLSSAASAVGSFFGTIHSAISGTIESGVRAVMGTATADNTLTNSEFNNAVASGDENAFYAGLEVEAAAMYNVTPAIIGEVGAMIIEGAASELMGPRRAPNTKTDITKPYTRPSNATTPAMRKYVNEVGEATGCARCGSTADKYYAGHKKALVQEYYETGTINETRMRSNTAVQPECPTCSNKEGAEMSRYSKEKKEEYGFNKE
ncbi:RHS repeat-associated core domain-containing protein, partial [Flagellimonas abyssi]